MYPNFILHCSEDAYLPSDGGDGRGDDGVDDVEVRVRSTGAVSDQSCIPVSHCVAVSGVESMPR